MFLVSLALVPIHLDLSAILVHPRRLRRVLDLVVRFALVVYWLREIGLGAFHLISAHRHMDVLTDFLAQKHQNVNTVLLVL